VIEEATAVAVLERRDILVSPSLVIPAGLARFPNIARKARDLLAWDIAGFPCFSRFRCILYGMVI